MDHTIFRHKFSDEFTVSLSKFAKIHQYDHRSDFKEAWATWTDDNEDLVATETRRLTNNGYEGDILDKMCKSARYYYRKKSTEKRHHKNGATTRVFPRISRRQSMHILNSL